MARGIFNSPVVGIVNKGFVGLINAPVIGRIVGRGLVVIRYVGRRSGRTFEIPVGYRRSGDIRHRVVGNAADVSRREEWHDMRMLKSRSEPYLPLEPLG